MPISDPMNIDERRKYLYRMEKRYKVASKEERAKLLDEMEKMTELHRKSLIRLMKMGLVRKRRSKQRGPGYGPAVDDALGVIAESLDYICAERLTPSLVPMALHLAIHDELQASPWLLQQLQRISVSTVRRRLKKMEQLDLWRLPRRRGRSQPNPLTQDIPMACVSWQEHEPGHFEVDLVHHCGPSAAHDYVHTIQMIDVATGWSERCAVLGRSQLVMVDAFRRMVDHLPFPILEIHPDNGGEFFNQHLLRFWQDTVHGLRLTRSRPFHKNDNRFVEQKNATLVRAYLGHERLDSVVQTLALNQLYDKMWLYYNLFQPVMRVTEKTVLSNNGAHRVRYRYDTPATPFERLCATKAITPERRQQLEQLRAQTNPRHLRQKIYDALDELFCLPGAKPGVTENVHDTLLPSLCPEKGDGMLVTLSIDRSIPSR